MATLFPNTDLSGFVLDKYISVKAAAETFGYNEAYLRRLLRSGRLQGIKIGQVWLIGLASLESHLHRGCTSQDQRFGPQGIITNGDRG